MSFSADPAGRSAPRRPVRSSDRLYLAGRFALSLALNGIALGGLFYAAFHASEPAPDVIEIPVELLPPPEDAPKPEAQAAPEKPQQKPPPEQQTLDDKPATDAPRAESHEKNDREAPDKATGGPRQAQPSEAAATGRTENKAQTAPDRPDETGEAEVVRDAAPKPAQESQQAAAKRDDPRKGTLSSAELLAAFQPMPEFEIGASARQTPVAGGAARSTYLTVLYGMVMPHMRLPPGAGKASGEIAFGVDEWGRLTYLTIRRASGSQALDGAAGAAVRAAAPFPPPPNHRAVGLSFTYGPK